eukprot:556881-Rhodomonas_salina.1
MHLLRVRVVVRSHRQPQHLLRLLAQARRAPRNPLRGAPHWPVVPLCAGIGSCSKEFGLRCHREAASVRGVLLARRSAAVQGAPLRAVVAGLLEDAAASLPPV